MSWYKKSESYKIYKAVCKRADQLDLLLQSGTIKNSEKERQILEVLNEITNVAIMILNDEPYNISNFKNWANTIDVKEE